MNTRTVRRARRDTEPLPVVVDADDPHVHALPGPYAEILLTSATAAHAQMRAEDDDFAGGWSA